jgi:hypothetical protein
LGLDQVIKADLEIIIFVVISGKDKSEFSVGLFDESTFFSVSNRAQVFNGRKNFSQNGGGNEQLGSGCVKNGLSDSGSLEGSISSYLGKG